MSNTIYELLQRLVKSLDSNYNVIDMEAVLEIISTLEITKITREQLEITRLGKFINQLRRKTANESLARRSKNLLKKWREMVMPDLVSNSMGSSAGTATTNTTNTVLMNNKIKISNGRIQSVNNNRLLATSNNNNNNNNNINDSTLLIDFDDNSNSCNKIAKQQNAINKPFGNAPHHQQQQQQHQQLVSFENLLSHAKLNNSDSVLPPPPPNQSIDDGGGGGGGGGAKVASTTIKLGKIPRINNTTKSNQTIKQRDSSMNLAAGMSSSNDDTTNCSNNSTYFNEKLNSRENLLNGLKSIFNSETSTSVEKFVSSNKVRNKGKKGLIKGQAPTSSSSSAAAANLYKNDNIFIYHDSLSNSESVSHFSNSNKNNNTSSNNNYLIPNINEIESDLTFKNKINHQTNLLFKSTNNINSINNTDTVIIDSSSDDDDDVNDKNRLKLKKTKCKIEKNTTQKLGISPSTSSENSRSNIISPLTMGANQNKTTATITAAAHTPNNCNDPIMMNDQLLNNSYTFHPPPVVVSQVISPVPPPSLIITNVESTSSVPPIQQPPPPPVQPKRRGRKKGSKGCDYELAVLGGFNSHHNSNSMMMAHGLKLGANCGGSTMSDVSSYIDIQHKLSMFSRYNTKKIKTTKELLAEIQNKKLGSSSSATSSPVLSMAAAAQLKNSSSPSSEEIHHHLLPSSDLTGPNSNAVLSSATIQTGNVTIGGGGSSLNIDCNSAGGDNYSHDNNLSSPPLSSTKNIDDNFALSNVSITAASGGEAAAAAGSVMASLENPNDPSGGGIIVDGNSKRIFKNIDDEITYLGEQLPKLEKVEINWEDEDVVPCTCQLKMNDNDSTCNNNNNDNINNNNNEMLNDSNIHTSNDLTVILTNNSNKISNDLMSSCNKQTNTNSNHHDNSNIIINHHQNVAPISISIEKNVHNTKKPIKSIFDLDYDDDDIDNNGDNNSSSTNNHNNAPSQKLNIIVNDCYNHNLNTNNNTNNNNNNINNRDNLTVENNICSNNNYNMSVPVGKTKLLSHDVPPSSHHSSIDTLNHNNIIINDNSNNIDDNNIHQQDNLHGQNDAAAAAATTLLHDEQQQQQLQLPQQQWIVDEDQNCKAKQFYEINKSMIKNYHIKGLHNYFINNINGNWDNYNKTSQITNLNECDYLNTDHNNDIDIYMNSPVVPKYNHIDNHKIRKNLLHINLNKKIRDKKLKKRIKKIKTNATKENSNGVVLNEGHHDDDIIAGSPPLAAAAENGCGGDGGGDDNKLPILFPNNAESTEIMNSYDEPTKSVQLSQTQPQPPPPPPPPLELYPTDDAATNNIIVKCKKRLHSTSSTSSTSSSSSASNFSNSMSSGSSSGSDDDDDNDNKENKVVVAGGGHHKLPNKDEDDDNNEMLLSFNHMANDNLTGVTADGHVFKEWHELVHIKSYNDEPLTILPYVVID